MSLASDGADVGRSQTAIRDSSNGVLLPSTEVQPGAPGSNPVQQPQAQQPGSNPDSAAQTEGVQSNLSSQQGQEPSEASDPDEISDAQWDEATRGAHHSDAEEPEQSDEADWEDEASEEDTSFHPSPAPSRQELNRHSTRSSTSPVTNRRPHSAPQCNVSTRGPSNSAQSPETTKVTPPW